MIEYQWGSVEIVACKVHCGFAGKAAHVCGDNDIDTDEAASLTAMADSIFLSGVIQAKQNKDIMTCDIWNAFVQTDIKLIGQQILMKIRGALVDILVEMDHEKYNDYVVYESRRKVLYVMMNKALYGMMQSSLLYYQKFRKDIESIGFIVNHFDPCMANRELQDAQKTVCWHVDDLKSSHIRKKVNDKSYYC